MDHPVFWIVVLLASLLLTLLLLLAAVLLLPCVHRKNHPLVPRLCKRHYAHRGLHNEELPENSLSAIKLAADKGYGMEFDLHLTLDGRLAVIHDGNLKRVCGVDLQVCSHPLAKLRAHPLKNGEPVPTLEEVLLAVDGRVPMLIELKNDGDNAKELVAAFLAAIKDYKGDFLVESFDPRVLLALKKQAPHIARGQLSCKYKKTSGHPFWRRMLLQTMVANAVTRPDFVAYRQTDRESLPCRLVRAAGVPLFFWTLRERDLALLEIEKGNAVIFEGFEL